MIEYPIFYGENKVGRGQLQRQGMYYQFRCRVRPPIPGKWRLWVRTDDLERDLGILVPEGSGYCTAVRFSVKDLSGTEFFFTIQKDSTSLKVELGSGRAVLSVKNLPSSRLKREGGKLFLVFGEDQDSSSPTGQ